MAKAEKDVVEAIKEYFKKHPDMKWKWGGQVLNSHDTIKKLDNDKNFRKHVVNAVIQFSIEQLMSGEDGNTKEEEE